ncbi:MAG: hypothetical protein QOI10_1543 [Solirubrobacterales bacterium]|jgi:hypothetical protein|nr:hypothetical protein [Solirubrobacterales bacterium]
MKCFVLSVAAAAMLAGAAPAAAQVGLPPLPSTPSDHAVMSGNVEYLGSIKQDVGMTAGAKVVGDRLFVTSGKNISIYDISDPASPKPLGQLFTNVAWENEEVPTNGKVLAVASDFYSVVPECLAALAPDGCVQFFDVRDPANIKQVGTIPIANHTAECALDCQYFYGRAGTIIDARGILDGTPPTVIGNWIDELGAQGVDEKSCHHIRELRPGILLSACQPFTVFSINAADGGSPAHPKVLYTGEAAKFVHSARWPRGGKDKFLLTGGEQNFRGRCELNNSEFSVYSAENVLRHRSTTFDGPIAQVPPAGNGYYADGKPVAGPLGCSVHWFQEHPTFRNGGLVAISEYEDGVRFLQIQKDGSIVEQGYFLSLGSSSSSPKWAGKDDVLYSIDYLRGIDILRWTGEHYVPGKHERGGVPGTNGVTPPPEPTRAEAAQRDRLAKQLRATGWAPYLCSLAGRT